MDFSSSMPSAVGEQSTDIELLSAIRLKQMRGLDVLYDRYGRLVYSVSLRVLNNAEEAEDITQEVFLKLWQHCDIYKSDRGSLSSFLAVMARSRSLDRLRSRKSHHRRLHQWHLDHHTITKHTSPFESATLEERSQLVKSALENLSKAEQEVLEQAYYNGLSQSEIAKRNDIPLGTVKSRSRQALKKLRNALKPLI